MQIDRELIRENQIAILGISLLLGLLGAAIITANGLLSFKKYTGEVITVTGSASQDILSDSATWECRFGRQSASMPDAYRALKADLAKVSAYLADKGFPVKSQIISSVATTTNYARNSDDVQTNQIESYTLTQTVRIQSPDVRKVETVSRLATELITQGVPITSESPQYFYTKLDSLKVKMLGDATKNARERAENMAKSTGNQIGLMRSAQMGVFQITEPNSTEVSDYGISDTSSLDKKVTAVVNVSFAVR